jgi:hypothetical protein
MKAISAVLAAALLIGVVDMAATSASAHRWGHRVCHSWREHHHWYRRCHWARW